MTTAAASPKQFEFLVRITLRDGSHGTHQGFYACGADAVLRAMQWFEPKRISAVRVKPQTVLNPAHPMNPMNPTNPVNNLTTTDTPPRRSAQVVPLVAPQREARSCHELGVCLHPARACGLRCEQVALQQLHRVVLAQPPRTDTPAAPTQPFGVEGPYRRERMTRSDVWTLRAAVAASVVTALAVVYVVGALVLGPLVQGAVALLAKVGG